MPTVTLARSDLFPVGTSVGIFPAGAKQVGGPPTAAAIASGTVDAAGNLSVTNAGLLSYTPYVAYAAVGGEHRYAHLRSTLDFTDTARGVGTGDTASGQFTLLNVAAASGAFAIGQRITGPGIPPGTFLQSGSGASWVMTDKATATGSGVAIEGHGASPAVAGGPGGIGASLVTLNITRWKARVAQRRSAAGTS